MAILIPLALLDLLSAAAILLYHFDLIGARLLLPLSIYLIAKGVLFRDPGSLGDMIAGLYGIGMIAFDVQFFLAYLFAAYLAQKAILSFKAFS